ncbi:hypothetical protein G7Y79_00005g016340 [Physcia stellaris]|nr:hypothetical protein G7Y79_00005g016340 [Physcia stellaris]
MGSLDIAGVIGTWAAAFIAILALVGIIGPILIWRASRTERHKALAAAANDNEFITKGIHAGPNIWLLQRVKASLLKTAPVLIDSTFVLNHTAFKEVTMETTWVSLGHLIKAYGLMPLWDGRFFGLAESSLDTDSLGHDSSDSEPVRLRLISAPRRTHRRDDDDDDDDDRPQRESIGNMVHQGPRAYQLLPASDRDPAMDAMARCFAADRDGVLVLSPVRDSHSMSKLLEEHEERTYVPAESPWIRLPRIKVKVYDQYSDAQETRAPVYVNRADAQEMVYSLLEMEWHPEG